MNKLAFLLLLATFCMLGQSKINHECQQHTIDHSQIGLTDEEPEDNRRNLQAQEWEPFRVTFDYSGLDSMSGDLEQYKDFIRHQGEIASKFFYDNLRVKRVRGNNRFPRWQSQCYHYNVTQSDKTTGIPDSDMHIYFTYKSEMKGYLAWAAACVQDYQTKRPRFAQVNWNAMFLQNRELNRNDTYEVFAEVTLHEITHALGFTSWLYDSWRNPETGRPYRAQDNQPKQTVTVNGEEFTYLTTPKIREFARKHFNCTTAKGMRVENNGGAGSVGSHWEKTLLENEFMTAQVMSHDAIYSNFTFALFEDSGWYKPTYKNVDAADWGKNKGCDFLENCDADRYREFVNDQPGDHCNFYHNAVAQSTDTVDGFGGNCKVPASTSRICIDSSKRSPLGGVYTGESYGENSRCFNSTVRTKDKFPYPQSIYDNFVGQARCLQYECDALGGINVIINNQSYSIDRTTNIVNITSAGSNQKIEGIVYGPEDWHGFCNTYPRPCKNFCSKNGYCMGNTCHCIDGFAGEDCSIPCATTDYVQNGVCLNSMVCPEGYEVKPETKECIRIPNPCPNQIRYNGQCLDSCPSRTYQDGNTCKACQENCLSCSNENSCQQCDLTHFEHNNKCVSQCPKKYYGNSLTQTCEQCSYGCQSCKSESECTKCSYGGYLFVDSARQQINCVSSCPQGYYVQNGSCVQCREGCDQCSSKNTCTSCSQSYYLFIDRQSNQRTCVQSCPFNSIQETQNRQCILCSLSEVYHEGKCTKNCPRGYYKNENSCSICDEFCETCSSAGTCNSCKLGLVLDSNTKQCVERNTSCPTGCSLCTDQNSCDTCDANKVKFVNEQGQGKCLDSCPSGFQSEGGICKKVQSQGTGSKKCGPTKYEYRTWRGYSYCISKCFGGTIPNSEGVCMRQ